MEGIAFNFALSSLKVISFVLDVITFPIYFILDNPLEAKRKAKEVRATIIDRGPNYITFRGKQQPTEFHIELLENGIDTMSKMLDYCSKKRKNNKCLGTREVLAEEDELQPNGKVYKKFVLGDYKWQSYEEVNTLATHFGRGLRELGNEPGKNVVIFSETRAEWMIAAHGLFKQSIPLVTIYATLGDEAIAHGINETEVSTVITSFELLPKFKQILSLTPQVKTIIYIEDQLKKLDDTNGFKNGVTIIKYKDVLEKGRNSNIGEVAPTKDDVAIIMYTSGSTGIPKGVMLQHKNLIATFKAFCDLTRMQDGDIMMGYLPLAHVFELLVESVCMCMGVPVGYSGPLTLIDSASKIKKGSKGDATVLRPTFMTAVPLILDRIAKGIHDKVENMNFTTRLLFRFAYEYKLKWQKLCFSTPLVDRIVFSKVQKIIGGRLRLIISGGAPLTAETQEQIKTCMCISLLQGYGLTETTSSATCQDEYDPTFGRIGPPLSGIDIKLVNWEEGNYLVTDKPNPRGEIVVGGENISIGYYKKPGNTKEDFFEENGRRWFKTGDIGEVDSDGVFRIIDRKKDLVKLQAGEYISLGKVESSLKTLPLVENLCVYGDSTKNFCVALVVPSLDELPKFAERLGITGKSFEELCDDERVQKAVTQQLAEHGRKCKYKPLFLKPLHNITVNRCRHPPVDGRFLIADPLW
ncbi:unnamed protein product [Acanthoscelides obtectus]|uniref:long-chain-fatty-acid--CoA ligase n=1 Tax=Acanthoscelides obtectus TaxID=200917 RepID=A0A9P0PK46_ACAOB|nr:unnamed protein product [Acanthoscelides obtectus]CAK1635159.1 Long-chain-fatty-acid--CoA ligase 3 [Acanthoscelides obtectus]